MDKPEKQQCPEIPYFGAIYPDATCIDGNLYDLDYCDQNGRLYQMPHNIPCPFCREEEFLQYHGNSPEAIEWIKKTKEKYK